MDRESMSKEELQRRLKLLQSELEDLEETITFNFTHSGAHISGKQVKEDEETLEGLKEEIALIKKSLSSSGPE